MGKFTDATIKALKPKSNPYKLYEKASDKGFHVQVTPAGKVNFGLAYTFNGKKRFLNLGDYSKEFGLKAARTKCRQKQTLIDDGVDPQLEKKKRISAQDAEKKRLDAEEKARARAATVDEILDHYLSSKAENTKNDAGRLFKNEHCDVRKEIGKMKIQDVTDDILEDLIDRHIERGKMRNAGKLYAYLQAAFKTAKKHREFHLKKWNNPFDSIDKPEGTDSKPVNRALSADEIKAFWKLLDDNPTDMMQGTAAIFKVLLLTGQRVEQTSRMQWSHLDLNAGTWEIPPDETKTGKRSGVGHIVPLTPMAAEIIQSMPKFEGEQFVFPGRYGGKPFSISGISNPLQKMLRESEIEHFTARDLRRTFTTHLSRLGVLAEIRNRIQDHAIAGDVESKHYNRFDYADQKRSALEKWEREIKRIIKEPTTSNVVNIREIAS